MDSGTTLSVPVAFSTSEWHGEFKKEIGQQNLHFGSNGWGEIFLIGDRLVVKDVTAGCERRLRDALDCMVQSAYRAARREIQLRAAAREELKLTLLTRAVR
jgi:hypothetical protein